MYISQAEENRNRAISASVTAAILALLLLFLILFHLITPNPPFPMSGGGGGQELALGMMNMGNDDIDYGKMGSVTDVVTEVKPEVSPEVKTNENILTDPNGEDVNIKEEKPEIKNNTTVIVPVKPKNIEKPRENTEAEKLAEKFKKNTGKNGGGIGDNETAGQNGSPDGNPDKNGNGGHGNGDGGGEGDGKGPGTGPGPGGPGIGSKYGVDLKGRAVVIPPQLPKDTKEEGKVVVEITVNNEGKVIEANPNGRGTTTNSRTLKEKAKAAALATKFNVDGKFDEQKGTITIVFAFD
jgi:TonB family protein